MAQLTLAFLDAFQAALDGQPITRFGSNINQGLLVYLALQSERPFSREALAALFWPEEPDSVAREKIRKAVYQLRKVVGDLDEAGRPHLLVTRQTVQFDAGSDYTLDVDDFLGAIERGDLETAVDQYHGDLLPGFAADSLPLRSGCAWSESGCTSWPWKRCLRWPKTTYRPAGWIRPRRSPAGS